MMESKKGVVRLEMLTKAALGAVLEFIYTGDVQILTEDDARDLIEMADYLFILPLKTLAGRVLAQTLNTSNCISAYYFAERYQCEELVSDAKKFIYANFASHVAKADEFLNMSSVEVNQKTVFKIIQTWIDQNKSERKKYFADLFRQVRLIYVSRDYLFNDIVTNDLVNDNACCFELVTDAIYMKTIDSNNSENISFPPPRKSLETPVIVLCVTDRDNCCKQLMCYVPRTNTWYKLRDSLPWRVTQMVSSPACHSTLYTLFADFESPIWERDFILLRYDSFFDRCTDVPYEGKRDLQQIFVSDNNEDGIYALESENEISCPDCASLHSCNGPEEESKIFTCGNQHLSYITRYKPESNSWEDISSFDLGLKMGICIVAKDNFIYFIGGAIHGTNKVLNDVDRYDLSKRKWDKLAGLQIARRNASGTAAHGKIFITGGLSEAGTYADSVKTCEVYNETKNEWHIIAKSSIVCRSIRASILCVDDKVYVVDDSCCNSDGKGGEIECYDPCKDKWDVITEIPSASPDLRYRGSFSGLHVGSCSMRVFKGRNLQQLQQPRPQGHVRFQDGGRRNPYTYLNRV
ncbi:kelch-like protein 21 [Oculina patagonica]